MSNPGEPWIIENGWPSGQERTLMSSLTPKEGGIYQPPKSPSGSTPVWIPVVLVVAIIALAAVGYGQYSSNAALKARIDILEDKLQDNAARVTTLQKADTSLASDIEVVTKKVGVTDQELASARKFAEKVRQDAEAAKAQLASELEKKANSAEVAKVGQDVVAAREEAKAKAEEVQKTADAKIGAVSGDVKAVDARVDATNRDLAESKRALVDVKNTLSDQIAKNSSELASLRLKGERDFFEFDLKKAKKDEMQRVGDIRLALKDVDTKKQKYNIVIQVDDNKLEKRDKLINEPVQFLVGRDKLRYEVVVNKVEKDRVVGYLSTPKDKALSAERPATRE
jgi:chromosome segregation ATPase